MKCASIFCLWQLHFIWCLSGTGFQCRIDSMTVRTDCNRWFMNHYSTWARSRKEFQDWADGLFFSLDREGKEQLLDADGQQACIIMQRTWHRFHRNIQNDISTFYIVLFIYVYALGNSMLQGHDGMGEAVCGEMRGRTEGDTCTLALFLSLCAV